MYIYVTGVLDKVPNTIFTKNNRKKKVICGRLSHPSSLSWSHNALLQVERPSCLEEGWNAQWLVWHGSPGNQTHSLGWRDEGMKIGCFYLYLKRHFSPKSKLFLSTVVRFLLDCLYVSSLLFEISAVKMSAFPQIQLRTLLSSHLSLCIFNLLICSCNVSAFPLDAKLNN